MSKAGFSKPLPTHQSMYTRLYWLYFNVPTRPGTKLSSNRSTAAMSLVRIHLRQKHRLKAPCAFSSLKSPSNTRYQTNPAVGKAKARRSDCCLLIEPLLRVIAILRLIATSIVVAGPLLSTLACAASLVVTVQSSLFVWHRHSYHLRVRYGLPAVGSVTSLLWWPARCYWHLIVPYLLLWRFRVYCSCDTGTHFTWEIYNRWHFCTLLMHTAVDNNYFIEHLETYAFGFVTWKIKL